MCLFTWPNATGWEQHLRRLDLRKRRKDFTTCRRKGLLAAPDTQQKKSKDTEVRAKDGTEEILLFYWISVLSFSGNKCQSKAQCKWCRRGALDLAQLCQGHAALCCRQGWLPLTMFRQCSDRWGTYARDLIRNKDFKWQLVKSEKKSSWLFSITNYFLHLNKHCFMNNLAHYFWLKKCSSLSKALHFVALVRGDKL